MKTVKRLFSQICSSSHLERAADLTVRGKRRRPDIAWFLFTREERLASLQRELRSQRYVPGPYEWITVRDPKPRLIARQAVEDRVVHSH